MSFNGNLKKYGVIAIVAGGILGVFAFGVMLNLTQLPNNGINPPPPVVGKGIGFRIAQKMLNSQDNVSYVWCYNNTWVNVNISEHYGRMIDGVRAGFINDTPSMALIHEPQAEIATINSSEFNQVMTSFRDAIAALNDTSTNTSINDIWPPTFLIDIAYDNGSSLSIVYSKEHNMLSVVNGTWTLSSFEHFGIKAIDVIMDYQSLVFFPLTDSSLMVKALQDFANYIYGLFPVQ
ncbi:MAG: hypothetical protein ACTSR2_09665 [Candidatus Hodarchaeales archaeon]